MARLSVRHGSGSWRPAAGERGSGQEGECNLPTHARKIYPTLLPSSLTLPVTLPASEPHLIRPSRPRPGQRIVWANHHFPDDQQCPPRPSFSPLRLSKSFGSCQNSTTERSAFLHQIHLTPTHRLLRRVGHARSNPMRPLPQTGKALCQKAKGVAKYPDARHKCSVQQTHAIIRPIRPTMARPHDR